MARRLVVITGASSGIGAAFARVFARKGWDLALVARREDRLNDLAEEMKAQFGVNSLVIAADLSKATAAQEIVKAVTDAGRQIDGLVNNAGAGQPGEFAETKWTDQKRFLQLMLNSYLELIHLVLPGMRERGFGRIVNVSSVSALLPPSPGHTKYSGTIYPGIKSALIKVCEALRIEGQDRNVNVSAVVPGYTMSEFHDVNGARATVSKLPSYWFSTAEEVATAGYDAVDRNVPVRVVGTWYKFMSGLARVLPDPAMRWLIASQTRRMAKSASN